MPIPKPDGYKGGDENAAEFIGQTLGNGPALNRYDFDPDILDDHRRGAVTNNWQEEIC